MELMCKSRPLIPDQNRADWWPEVEEPIRLCRTLVAFVRPDGGVSRRVAATDEERTSSRSRHDPCGGPVRSDGRALRAATSAEGESGERREKKRKRTKKRKEEKERKRKRSNPSNDVNPGVNLINSIKL